jgi:hypothetical protein
LLPVQAAVRIAGVVFILGAIGGASSFGPPARSVNSQAFAPPSASAAQHWPRAPAVAAALKSAGQWRRVPATDRHGAAASRFRPVGIGPGIVASMSSCGWCSWVAASCCCHQSPPPGVPISQFKHRQRRTALATRPRRVPPHSSLQGNGGEFQRLTATAQPPLVSVRLVSAPGIVASPSSCGWCSWVAASCCCHPSPAPAVPTSQP